MSRLAFNIAVAAFILFVAGNGHAQAAEKAPAYDTFHLVRTRNMFDPNRRPSRVDASASQKSSTLGKQSRGSMLMLTGTMVTAGKTLAFFSGTRAEFSRVISVGDTIADCKITAIKLTAVDMERAGKSTPLAVGQQLQIDGSPSDVPVEETPAVTGAPADPSAPNTAGPAAADSTSSSAPTNDKNEILRRMMERRAKELSK